MRIKCKECGEVFSSLVIGEQAIADVVILAAKHFPVKHGKQAMKLRNDVTILIQYITWYLSLQSVEIPDLPENKLLIEKVDEVRQKILDYLYRGGTWGENGKEQGTTIV